MPVTADQIIDMFRVAPPDAAPFLVAWVGIEGTGYVIVSNRTGSWEIDPTFQDAADLYSPEFEFNDWDIMRLPEQMWGGLPDSEGAQGGEVSEGPADAE